MNRLFEHFVESKHHEGMAQDGGSCIDLLSTCWRPNTKKDGPGREVMNRPFEHFLESKHYKRMAQEGGLKNRLFEHFLESKHYKGMAQEGGSCIDFLSTFWSPNTIKGWPRKGCTNRPFEQFLESKH